MRGQRAAERPDALVAGLGDLARPLRKGDRHEYVVGPQTEQAPFWSSELNARSNDSCQSFLPPFQCILRGRCFADVRIAAEAGAAVGAAAREAQDLGRHFRLMFPMADPDQLQPSGAEREFIIAVDVAV